MLHTGGTVVALTHEHEGIWVGVLPSSEVPDYRLEVSYDGGTRTTSTTPTASCPPSARSTST